MKIPIYQIDAFADGTFKGNPAAVCPLDHWLPDTILQCIAEENNLSETSFFVGNAPEYHLRWFTPNTEPPLPPFPATPVSPASPPRPARI
jgi:PhzF family phenazine biosynthesis protein